MNAEKKSELLRSACGAAAVVILVLMEAMLAIMTGAGAGGAFITFIAAPVVFFVRTPRSWIFLALVSLVLALVPAILTAAQLLEPSTATVARVWSRDSGWVDLERPSPLSVATTAAAIASVLVTLSFAALALWKRAAIRRGGLIQANA